MKTSAVTQVQTLEQLVSLLKRFGEIHWSRKIEDVLSFLRKDDIYGAERFITYFGDMGLLNDVWLCDDNGHSVPSEMQQKINAEFDALKLRAWNIANEVTRNI